MPDQEWTEDDPRTTNGFATPSFSPSKPTGIACAVTEDTAIDGTRYLPR
ncbi:hypothetical protein [Nocardia sp. A7]